MEFIVMKKSIEHESATITLETPIPKEFPETMDECLELLLYMTVLYFTEHKFHEILSPALEQIRKKHPKRCPLCGRFIKKDDIMCDRHYDPNHTDDDNDLIAELKQL